MTPSATDVNKRRTGTPPEFLTLIWFAGVIEPVGGVLLAAVLFSRATAFILSGELAFASTGSSTRRGASTQS